MAITAIVESQVVAGATATGVLYVTAGGLLASDGPTWDGSTFRIDSLGNPGVRLQAAANSGNPLLIYNASGNFKYQFYIEGDGTAAMYIGDGSEVIIRENGSTHFNGGKVGINDSTPDAMLDIVCTAATDVGLQIELAAAQSANALDITTNGGTAGDVFKIDSAGAATFSGSLSHSPDATGKLTRGMASETHTLSLATTSDTTTISIPSGARLLAVQMNVDTAVTDGAGDDTWSAAFITGSTTTIATAAAAALNTKVNLMLPDEITTGIAQIRFTPNAGSFTAGVIEMTVYYEFLTSLANA